jgi:cysteine desulfurase
MALVGNPSSVHRAGQSARAAVEAARARVAAAVGAPARSVVFTSGGTEANGLALASAASGRVLVSAIEHDSVVAHAPHAERIPVTRDGAVDLAALDALLAGGDVALVSVMAANNETGVVQPLVEIAARVHAAGAKLHCDATQALGKMAPPALLWGANMLTVSAHKIGGPAGIGALVLAPGVAVPALQRGGGQEFGLRAGTENKIGIIGFAAALEALAQDRDWPARTGHLRDRLEATIAAVCPEALVVPSSVPRLPTVTSLWMPGVPAEVQVMAFDLAGFAVSAGSACSSGKVRPSPVLRAMGLSEAVGAQSIRVSPGWETTADDIDAFADAWISLHARRASKTHEVAA